MIAFEVNDMTCGHCVGAINKALKAVDGEAKVDIDLGRHLVQIRSEHADAQTPARRNRSEARHQQQRDVFR